MTLGWGLMLVLMAAWSLLAWGAYALVDPLLAWLGAGLPALVQGGQGAVEAFGGKPAGDMLTALDAGGLANQLFALVRLIAKPAIVLIWGVGMLALFALPMLVSVFRRFAGSFGRSGRH